MTPVLLLAAFAVDAHAESVIEFKTTGPVAIFVDGQQATLTSNLRQRVNGLTPGSHQLEVSGMFGKKLYEAEIDLPDNTITYASWERGEIKVLKTEWLSDEDQVAEEEYSDTGAEQAVADAAPVIDTLPLEGPAGGVPVAAAPAAPEAPTAPAAPASAPDTGGGGGAGLPGIGAPGVGAVGGAVGGIAGAVPAGPVPVGGAGAPVPAVAPGAPTAAAPAAPATAAAPAAPADAGDAVAAADPAAAPAAPAVDPGLIVMAPAAAAPVAGAVDPAAGGAVVPVVTAPGEGPTNAIAVPPTRANTLTVQGYDGMRVVVTHEGRQVVVVVDGNTFRIQDANGLNLALGGSE